MMARKVTRRGLIGLGLSLGAMATLYPFLRWGYEISQLSPFIKLPPGGAEAGPCEHLGWRGVVYRYEGVAVLPHAAFISRDLDVCIWRGVVL